MTAPSNDSLIGSHEITVPSVPPTLSSQAPLTPLLADLQKQTVISGTWIDQSSNPLERLQFVKIKEQTSSSYPLVITHSVVVDQDLTWKVYVHGHQVNPQCLSHIPAQLQAGMLQQLLSTIDRLNVCAGHPDAHFLEMMEAKKGSLKSATGSVAAYVDANAAVKLNGQSYSKPLRSTSCQLLSSASKCPVCVSYRVTIRATYHRYSSINFPFSNSHAYNAVKSTYIILSQSFH